MDDSIRIGLGYDIHKVQSGNNGLWIGGVKVSEALQFIAHSDGDVLIHALIDSLLGAAGMMDIGELFPNHDPRYKGIKSTQLLVEVASLLKEKRVKIINIDAVVVMEKIKLAPFKEPIRQNISKILSIDANRFNLKAKTKEGIGEVGLGKAIESYCCTLIRL